jgi:hypothetical protein
LEFPNCLATIIINYTPDIKPFSGAVAGDKRRIISLVNWAPSNATSLFWRRCRGRSRRLLQGEFFAHTSFTLLFVLLYFTLFILLASFYQKPKKIRILGSCYFFTLVHYVVP